MSTGSVWVQNNLRSEDNLPLAQACKENEQVIAIYFFDPRQFEMTKYGFKKTGKFRAKFLIETITELKEKLAVLNIPLFIYHEKPEKHLLGFLKQHSISNIYLQEEWTSEEKNLLSLVKNAVPKNIQFKTYYDQFLFHPEDIPYPDFSEIPKVFTDFRKKCEAKVSVRKCTPTLKTLKEENFNLKKETEVPDLKQLGFGDFQQESRTAFPFKGGENQAKKRIQQYF
jgi:deoxyribodipyrimidine photo-lyase